MTREQTGPWNTQNRLARSKHRRGVAALRPPVPEKRGLWRGRGCDASRAASHALLPRHRAGAAWPPARPPVPRQSHLATSHHRWCMCGPRVRGGGCFLPRVPRCRPTGPSPPQAPAACEEAPLTRRSVRTRRQLSHGLGARILMTADNRKAPASNHLARCMGRKLRGPQSGLAKCRSVRTDGGRGGMGGDRGEHFRFRRRRDHGATDSGSALRRPRGLAGDSDSLAPVGPETLHLQVLPGRLRPETGTHSE